MKLPAPRIPSRPPVDARYPITFAAAPLAWTLTGTSSTIESVTNYTLWVPAVAQLCSFSVVLPAGYIAGTTRYPVVWHAHGQTLPPTPGNCYVAGVWPASHHIAVSAGAVRPHITVFLCLGEHSMGTNLPDGASLFESVMLAVHRHIHATFRTLGIDGQHNAWMAFSMGARFALYALFKYAKLFHEGKHPWRFGGAAVFGAPVYDENYDYANDSGLQDFARACISPDGAYTAEELRVWGTKCAQTHISLPALEGVLVRLGYAGADPVRTVSGAAWNTRMNAEGVTHQFSNTIQNNTPANFGHSATSYWSSTNSNTLNDFYQSIETIFAGTVA